MTVDALSAKKKVFRVSRVFIVFRVFKVFRQGVQVFRVQSFSQGVQRVFKGCAEGVPSVRGFKGFSEAVKRGSQSVKFVSDGISKFSNGFQRGFRGCSENFRILFKGVPKVFKRDLHVVQKLFEWMSCEAAGRHVCCNGGFGLEGAVTSLPPSKVMADFGQTDFGQNRLWPNEFDLLCVVLCCVLSVWRGYCFTASEWGFMCRCWFQGLVLDRPSPRETLNLGQFDLGQHVHSN